MPGVHGVSGLLYLRAQHPEVPVVIVSASDDAAHHPPLPRLRRVGVHPQVAAGRAIREAIRKIIGGEVWLPPDVDLSQRAGGRDARSSSPGSPRSRRSRCACS